ncbi:GerMN domain-containing protein [Streptomyces achmelvichensis]|uniref:GerMN domain-containing protein n=1 Tax=Streptomyces achmelvichensis TaxID=3134111 RepID=UPI003C12C053
MAAASLIATATSCGIDPTDVIAAGPPPSGIQQPGAAAHSVRLYFASQDGIRAVSRRADRPMNPTQALDLLRQGPTKGEVRRGLKTHVPPMKQPIAVTTAQGTVKIHLPPTVTFGDLDVTAVSQITCTAANADMPGNDTPTTQVKVRMYEGNRHSQDPWTLLCDANGHARPLSTN